ncbi:M56 family metallopeptidase [Pedobacter psychroterrae]|uniref:M56 family metallopeptidase n=1 Tax=Pedobacter psychroterrae TaxID=2530453 RepID=A0A4R0NIC1_9SPHI|nr:M56 family metallopeptidase [Pedobacter psychroterrae]TCD00410.1 M56 family metallopeptidase [Pedobacter psychroterrae]
MMSWLYYLLEANLYLAVFYGFYRLFLHRETFYQLNRYYLLGTSMLAFLLPMFQISYLDSLLHPVENQATVTIQYAGELLPVINTAPVLTAGGVLFTCYLLVATFFLFRLGTSLYGIFRMAARADKTYKDGIIRVHFSQSDTAFSFFNLLFINPGTEKQNIILQHEMIHIRQKHSFDVLFFEMLLICNWFNPLCWLMKQDIKLVHEYIADEATTNQGLVKHDYALFLIHNSFGSFPNTLTSQMFNQSILKNRISMLNKKRSAGRARLRLLYVLPLTGGMLCASTLGFTKDYALVDLYARKTTAVSSVALQEPKQQAKQAATGEKKKTYPIESVYDAETGNNRPIKLIVINGKISKAQNFSSVSGFDQVKELNNSEAVAKYGKRVNKGALEFTGKNTGISIKFPPPRPVKTTPPLARKNNNKVVKFPPPLIKPDVTADPKLKEEKQVKFPPPIVKPLKKYDENTEKPAQTAKLDVGLNPLYIIDGKITVVNSGEGKIVKFTAKSVKVQPKNNDAAIKKYGEAARDGVIELEDGEVFYAEPEAVKKE